MASKSLHSTVMDVASKKPKLKPGKATSIEIRKADDKSGYIVRTHQEDKDTYMPSHESVHKNLSSVSKHCKDCFEGPKDDDGDNTDAM